MLTSDVDVCRFGPRTALRSQTDWDQLRLLAVNFAKLWCRSREDAQDIAHEALLALLRNGESVREIIPWLYVVIRRIALHLKREERLRCNLQGDVAGPSMSGHIEFREFIRHTHLLNKKQRRVLVLTILGYTHKEIADRMRCGRGDVGQYVNRALRRLNATATFSVSEGIRDVRATARENATV